MVEGQPHSKEQLSVATQIIRVKTAGTKAQYLTESGTSARKDQAARFDSLTGVEGYVEWLRDQNPESVYTIVRLHPTLKKA